MTKFYQSFMISFDVMYVNDLPCFFIRNIAVIPYDPTLQFNWDKLFKKGPSKNEECSLNLKWCYFFKTPYRFKFCKDCRFTNFTWFIRKYFVSNIITFLIPCYNLNLFSELKSDLKDAVELSKKYVVSFNV